MASGLSAHSCDTVQILEWKVMPTSSCRLHFSITKRILSAIVGALLMAMASHAMTLRVDVQNLPRAAVDAGITGQFVVRLAQDKPNLSLHDLKHTLQARLTTVFESAADALLLAPVDFEIEVYDAKADQFHPLVSAAQLGRRSRLNLVLRHNDNTLATSHNHRHLALPARAFQVNTNDGSFHINGAPIYVSEMENSGLGTGLTTWDGSVVLAKYLEHKYLDHGDGTSSLVGKRVIEVGAGTGVVGLAAALVGASEVLLTDLEYTMANLRRNIARTLKHAPASVVGTVAAEVLDWFNPREDLGDVDLVLASDVVWVEELIPPLVKTLYTIVRKSRVSTTILMSHQQRSVASDTLLFRELEARGFVRNEVVRDQLHPSFVSDKIHVWKLTLRS